MKAPLITALLLGMLAAAASAERIGNGTLEKKTRPSNTEGSAPAFTFVNPNRPHSPLYTNLVAHYMAGEWSNLAADIDAKQAEIAALSAEDAADLKYVRETLAECRFPWWEQIKQNKQATFDVKVWDKSLRVNFAPGDQPLPIPRMEGDRWTIDVAWNTETLDSSEPLDLHSLGLNIEGEHGFTKGDVADVHTWNSFGLMIPRFVVGLEAYAKSSPTEKRNTDLRSEFWGALVPAYYGTPETRRYMCFLGTISLNTDFNQSSSWRCDRQLGRLLLVEWMSHRDRYPSLRVEPDAAMPEVTDRMAEWGEMYFANRLAIDGFMKQKLTLAEDRWIRQAIKDFAMANAAKGGTPIQFPNHFNASVDLVGDAQSDRRYAWLKQRWEEQQDKPVESTFKAASPAPHAAIQTLNFDGPRQSSPLYDDFVKRYLTGDWAKLAGDIDAKQTEIATMPAGNAADIAYIRQALAECRPTWWEQAQSTKSVQFKQVLWDETISYLFMPGRSPVSGFAKNSVEVGWVPADLESTAPFKYNRLRFSLPGPSFAKRNQAEMEMWGRLARAGLLAHLGPQAYLAIPNTDQAQFQGYAYFWQQVTAGYYSTPTTRRLVAISTLSSMIEPTRSRRDSVLGEQAAGTALLIELREHKDYYKSLHMETVTTITAKELGDVHPEYLIAKPLALQFDAPLTLEEDRHLHDFYKQLAGLNNFWNTPVLVFGNNLVYSFDKDRDVLPAAARLAYINGGTAPVVKP